MSFLDNNLINSFYFNILVVSMLILIFVYRNRKNSAQREEISEISIEEVLHVYTKLIEDLWINFEPWQRQIDFVLKPNVITKNKNSTTWNSFIFKLEKFVGIFEYTRIFL